MNKGFIGLEGLAITRAIGGREGLHNERDYSDPLLPDINSDDDSIVDGDWAISNGDWAANGDWAFG